MNQFIEEKIDQLLTERSHAALVTKLPDYTIWLRQTLIEAMEVQKKEDREMLENLKKENQNSEDYAVGEHWSTFGYPKALDEAISKLQ